MTRKYNKIAVIGGDMRQITAAKELSSYGYEVKLSFFDTYTEVKSQELSRVMSEADAILLPIPVMRGELINTPFSHEKLTLTELFDTFGEKLRLIIGGVIPKELSKKAEERGISVFDLCESEGFNILNAVPTAEGAIAIAMGGMSRTVFGSRTAVVGYGRIGKTLCRLLSSLGSQVTAVSRSEGDLAFSSIFGFDAVDHEAFVGKISEQDVIFNTVPHTVLGEEQLSQMKKEAFVVDLASRPGGVDLGAASRLGVRVISALSLPGKVAPVSAGKIIAECSLKKLREVGI